MTRTTATARSTAFSALATHELKRYLKHPLFLVGAALTVAVAVMGPDETSSSIYHVIVPATTLGLFGLLVMVSLVRGSDSAAAAGAAVASERTRTLALAAATVVPFVVALGFFGWAVWVYHDTPPLPSAIPFGDVGDNWVYAVLFALGVLPAVGGPILGLVIGRWLSFRGAGVVSAVLLVMATIVMLGIVEPLRYIRVFMPWTYFGGPYGVEGDPERWLILTGSPFWYCLYLVALCAIGVIVALLHDREQPRNGLAKVFVVGIAVAAVLCLLAMTTGVQEVLVNPVPSQP